MSKTEINLNPDLSYDPLKQTVTIKGEIKTLTTKESELFHVLASHLNDLTERKVALDQVWAEDSYFAARSMDVYITKLRKILKPLSGVEIINIHGKGYKLLVDNAYNQETILSGCDS